MTCAGAENEAGKTVTEKKSFDKRQRRSNHGGKIQFQFWFYYDYFWSLIRLMALLLLCIILIVFFFYVKKASERMKRVFRLVECVYTHTTMVMIQ